MFIIETSTLMFGGCAKVVAIFSPITLETLHSFSDQKVTKPLLCVPILTILWVSKSGSGFVFTDRVGVLHRAQFVGVCLHRPRWRPTLILGTKNEEEYYHVSRIEGSIEGI